MKNNFQADVDWLLAEIDSLYPPGEIAERKEKLNRFWHGKTAETRLPYIVMDFSFKKNWQQLPDTYTQMQRELIDNLRAIIEHAAWHDDYVPTLNPGLIQATIPSCFGAKEEYAEKSVRVVPAIKDPSDVETLPYIGFPPDSPGGNLLSKMKFFQEMTYGKIPINAPDMQGPFSAASQLWGIQEFLLATYTNPDEVNLLLRRTTKAVIEYFKLMRQAVGDNLSPCHCYPCLWMPPDCGRCVSEDFLAIVSPETTRTFINPALAELGREFGKILVHTCGSLNHAASVIREIDVLCGVNCSSSETDIQKLIRTAGKDFLYIIHHAGVHDPALKVFDLEGQGKLCRDVFGREYCAVALLTPVSEKSADPEQEWKKLQAAVTF